MFSGACGQRSVSLARHANMWQPINGINWINSHERHTEAGSCSSRMSHGASAVTMGKAAATACLALQRALVADGSPAEKLGHQKMRKHSIEWSLPSCTRSCRFVPLMPLVPDGGGWGWRAATTASDQGRIKAEQPR